MDWAVAEQHIQQTTGQRSKVTVQIAISPEFFKRYYIWIVMWYSLVLVTIQIQKGILNRCFLCKRYFCCYVVLNILVIFVFFFFGGEGGFFDLYYL